MLNDDRINKIGKSFAKFVSLNILSMLAMSFYILADTIFVANIPDIGADCLTALQLVLPFFSLLNGVGVLLGVGGATLYSVAKGAGDDERANRIFTQVMIIGGVLGALFTILGLTIPTQIVSMLGAKGEIVALAVTYLKALSICNLPFVVNHIMLAFVRNDNAPRLAMTAVVVSSLFNVLLDWILIFPCGLGIFGASFATGLASVVSLIIMSWHFIRRKNNFRFQRPSFHFKDIRFTLAAGFPSMLAELSNGIVILVFNMLILKIGGENGGIAINAYSVTANLALIAMFTFNGISQGTQPLFSINYGAGKKDNIRKIMLYGCATALGMATLYYVSFFLGRDGLIKLFNNAGSVEMAEIAREAIVLYNIAYFAAALNIVATALFATNGKPMFSFIISILRGLALPLGLAFLLSSTLELKGIWLTMPIAEFITLFVSIILLVIHQLKDRKDRRVECQD